MFEAFDVFVYTNLPVAYVPLLLIDVSFIIVLTIAFLSNGADCEIVNEMCSCPPEKHVRRGCCWAQTISRDV